MKAPATHLLFADISDYQLTFDAQAYARAGRRLVMIKQGDGAGPGGSGQSPERCAKAHRSGLHVIHYLMARYDESPSATIDAYFERIRPCWHKGDRMLIDIEAYSGPVADSYAWLKVAQVHVTSRGAPRAIVYTNESYLAEGGQLLAELADWWHIAAYDGRRLARGTPVIPGRTKAQLFAKQYTNGQEGAQPYLAPGIGACDNSILTCAGARYTAVANPPRLRRRRRLPARRAC